MAMACPRSAQELDLLQIVLLATTGVALFETEGERVLATLQQVKAKEARRQEESLMQILRIFPQKP